MNDRPLYQFWPIFIALPTFLGFAVYNLYSAFAHGGLIGSCSWKRMGCAIRPSLLLLFCRDHLHHRRGYLRRRSHQGDAIFLAADAPREAQMTGWITRRDALLRTAALASASAFPAAAVFAAQTEKPGNTSDIDKSLHAAVCRPRNSWRRGDGRECGCRALRRRHRPRAAQAARRGCRPTPSSASPRW